MLNKLFLKFKKLDELYLKKESIFLKSQYTHNHVLLKQVLNDSFKLRDFLKNNKISPEDTLKVSEIAAKKFPKVHSLEEIKCLINIFEIVNYDSKELIMDLIKRTNNDILNLEIMEKLLIFDDLLSLTQDKEIHLTISKLKSESLDLFLKSVNLDPRKLDKWICNLRDVFKKIGDDNLVSENLVNEYRRHEIIYLQVCLKLISKDDIKDDLKFLVNKIRKRSAVFKICLEKEIKEVILGSGIDLSSDI